MQKYYITCQNDYHKEKQLRENVLTFPVNQLLVLAAIFRSYRILLSALFMYFLFQSSGRKRQSYHKKTHCYSALWHYTRDDAIAAIVILIIRGVSEMIYDTHVVRTAFVNILPLFVFARAYTFVEAFRLD